MYGQVDLRSPHVTRRSQVRLSKQCLISYARLMRLTGARIELFPDETRVVLTWPDGSTYVERDSIDSIFALVLLLGSLRRIFMRFHFADKSHPLNATSNKELGS